MRIEIEFSQPLLMERSHWVDDDVEVEVKFWYEKLLVVV